MNYTQPILLGDIFDRTFKLIGKTFSRIIIVGPILIIPGSLLLVVGLDWLYSTLGDFIQLEREGTRVGFEQAMQIAAGVFILIPGIFIFAIAITGARVAAITIVCSEIAEKAITWKDALSQAFQKKVWKALGQLILESLLYIGIFVVWGIIIAVVAAASLKLGVVLMMILFFSIFGVIMYCAVRWFLTTQVIVWEDSKIMNSFSRSAALVSNHWWRSLGIIILFSLLLSFAESLITTPMMFITMWKSLGAYFQEVGVSGAEHIDPEVVGKMMSSLGFTVGVAILFSSIFRLLIEPAYRSVMYFDLRARQGEFTEKESPRPFASYFGQTQA